MNTKNNQRYKEMDICMKAAMLELMQKNDFEKITVKAICERAGVNRGTFYSHYVDIYDMIDEIEDYLSEGLLQAAEEGRQTGQAESSLVYYIKYMKKHQYFYKTALTNRKSLPITKTFRPLWEKYIVPRCGEAGIFDEKDREYYFIFFRSGITMVLKHWIEDGCRKSEEDLAQLLLRCIPHRLQTFRAEEQVALKEEQGERNENSGN